MQKVDTDVLVVGAGPTGLMLAGELTLQGAQVIVLDRLAEPTRQSRALGFSARAIEEFTQRGLAPAFGDLETIPVGHFGGIPLDFREVDGGSYGARGKPQFLTESVLAAWAVRQGAQVLRNHEVTGLMDSPEGVTVQARTPDGEKSIRARYVAGCDGGASTIRKLLGVEFSGTEPTMELMFADVAGCQLRPRFSGERVSEGMVMVLPLGPEANRVVVYERESTRKPGVDPTFEEVCAAWHRLTGEDISAGKPLWTSVTTDASRQATEYRRGRVFLLGDAAHIHLPIGAQGMSAGIGDAVNLGWKLAAVLAGWAPDELLDSFHTERHPVGARIIANTLAQRILYLGGDEFDPMRAVFQEILQHPEARQLLIGMVTGLDIHYEMRAGHHALLGRRLPPTELADADQTMRSLERGRAALINLAVDGTVAKAAQPWSRRLDIIESEPRAGGALDGASCIFVRPDGYIAWVGMPHAPADGLAQALTAWLGAPPEETSPSSSSPLPSPAAESEGSTRYADH